MKIILFLLLIPVLVLGQPRVGGNPSPSPSPINPSPKQIDNINVKYKITHCYRGYTVHEWLIGPGNGQYNPATKTWVDSCAMGTPGYVIPTDKGAPVTPRLIERSMAQGGATTDSTGLNLLRRQIENELKGKSLQWQNGKGQVFQAQQGSMTAQQNAGVIINAILADPQGVVVFDLYEYPIAIPDSLKQEQLIER